MEYKVREFEGTAMLALEAAERGWGVIFGSKIIRSRPNLPRGIIIEKWISRGMLPKIAASYMRGRKLSAWCEEGLVYQSAEAYGRRKVELKTYALLDAFFAWGRNQAEDLVDKLGCDGAKLTITGNPRFDLHRADLRAIFADKVAKIRHRYGEFILINTSFPDFNGYFTPDFTLEKLRKLRVAQTPELEAEVRSRGAFQEALFTKFMELVEELSRRFPGSVIVVRPHPSENLVPWKNKARTLPNVEVIRDGNVAEWILAAAICIHNNCTTGVEAYLFDKASIAYCPVSDTRFDLFLPNVLSVKAFTVKSVLDLVSAALHGEAISDDDAAIKAEVARRYIANIEGTRACERILDVLDCIPMEEEALSFSANSIRDLRTAMGRKIRLAKAIFKGGAPAAQKRSSKNNLDGVDKAEMLVFLRDAQKATGRFGKVQVAELEKNVLCVY